MNIEKVASGLFISLVVIALIGLAIFLWIRKQESDDAMKTWLQQQREIEARDFPVHIPK